MKVCPRCHEAKAPTEFRKNRASKDGCQTYCKPCQIAINRLSRAGKPRAKRPSDNPENWRRGRLRWRAANPQGRIAHLRVARAIQSGRLLRPDSCGSCGTHCNPQAHHDDYSKPLEVRWLCSTCHRRHHAGVAA